MLKRRTKIKAISIGFFILSIVLVLKVARSIIFAENSLQKLRRVVISTEKNSFSDVSYKMFDENGESVSLKSSKIKEVNKNTLNFKKVELTFRISPDEMGNITADRSTATNEQKVHKSAFFGNVVLSTEKGLTLRSEESFVDFDAQTAKGNKPISITQKCVQMNASKYDFDMAAKIMTLIGHVNGKINSDKISADTLVAEFENRIGQDLKKITATGNSSYKTPKYELSAQDKLVYTSTEVLANKHVFLHYQDKVKSYKVHSDNMVILLKGSQVDRVKAKGHVKIESKDVKIKGESGDLVGDLLTISDNVFINSDRGNIICEKATLNLKTNEVRVLKSKGVVSFNRK